MYAQQVYCWRGDVVNCSSSLGCTDGMQCILKKAVYTILSLMDRKRQSRSCWQSWRDWASLTAQECNIQETNDEEHPASRARCKTVMPDIGHTVYEDFKINQFMGLSVNKVYVCVLLVDFIKI